MTRRARLLDDETVEVQLGDQCAQLTPADAVALALDLLAESGQGRAAATYGSIDWLSVGDVVQLLRVPRATAGRLMARWTTTHRRVPGGDRYVARGEVEAWAARVLGVVRRRAS